MFGSKALARSAVDAVSTPSVQLSPFEQTLKIIQDEMQELLTDHLRAITSDVNQQEAALAAFYAEADGGRTLVARQYETAARGGDTWAATVVQHLWRGELDDMRRQCEDAAGVRAENVRTVTHRLDAKFKKAKLDRGSRQYARVEMTEEEWAREHGIHIERHLNIDDADRIRMQQRAIQLRAEAEAEEERVQQERAQQAQERQAHLAARVRADMHPALHGTDEEEHHE